MKNKQNKYKKYIIIMTIVFSMLIIYFIITKNFISAVIFFLIAIFSVFFFMKRRKEVLSDERILLNAGKAARIVMGVSTISMAIIGIILISLRELNESFMTIGNILIYIECFMIILYQILFNHYNKK